MTLTGIVVLPALVLGLVLPGLAGMFRGSGMSSARDILLNLLPSMRRENCPISDRPKPEGGPYVEDWTQTMAVE